MFLTLPITLGLTGGFASLAVLFGWLGARPTTPGQPRLAPWQFMMMIAAALAVLMIVHLLSIITGKS